MGVKTKNFVGVIQIMGENNRSYLRVCRRIFPGLIALFQS